MVKALLLHVGVDQTERARGEKNDMTLGVNGPIFDDGTFEFIPVLESWELEWSRNVYFSKKGERIIAISDGNEYYTTSDGKKLLMEFTSLTLTSETRTYFEVATRNEQNGKRLSEYLPQKYENVIIHFDPDFEHFTYGDSVAFPRGPEISKLEENDYIFFVASLAPYVKEAYAGRDKNVIRRYQQRKMAKFVIGYFKVQGVYRAVKSSNDPVLVLYGVPENSDSVNDKAVDEATLARILNNAHTKRSEDKYFIIVGNQSESALLKRAVRLTRNGSPFKPDKIGEETYGDINYPRGHKWVYDSSRIQNLLNYCKSCV